MYKNNTKNIYTPGRTISLNYSPQKEIENTICDISKYPLEVTTDSVIPCLCIELLAIWLLAEGLWTECALMLTLRHRGKRQMCKSAWVQFFKAEMWWPGEASGAGSCWSGETGSQRLLGGKSSTLRWRSQSFREEREPGLNHSCRNIVFIQQLQRIRAQQIEMFRGGGWCYQNQYIDHRNFISLNFHTKRPFQWKRVSVLSAYLSSLMR